MISLQDNLDIVLIIILAHKPFWISPLSCLGNKVRYRLRDGSLGWYFLGDWKGRVNGVNLAEIADFDCVFLLVGLLYQLFFTRNDFSLPKSKAYLLSLSPLSLQSKRGNHIYFEKRIKNYSAGPSCRLCWILMVPHVPYWYASFPFL